MIIGDLQGGLIEEETISLADLSRCRDAMRSFENVADDARTTVTLRKLANFFGELIEALSESEPADASDALDDVTPPTLDLRYTRMFDSRDDVPADVPEEAITERRERQYVGEGGQYTYETVVDADIVDPAEALARAKRMYVDTLIQRIRRGKWSDTPITFDSVLAALAAAGFPSRPCRIAAGTPTVLDHCPRYDSRLGTKDGARLCTERGYGWSEQTDHFTDADSTPARIYATPEASSDGIHGLGIRRAPPVDALPDPDDVLVLDATPRPDELATVFGVDEREIAIDGNDAYALPDVTVTQIVDGAYHRATFEQSATACERAQRAVDQINQLHDDVVNVTIQKAKGLIDWPDDAEVLGYYSLRGLNRSDADAVVCVGAPHPAEDDLRADA